VFLSKQCPSCGQTEALISSDSSRYMTKRSLDREHRYAGCRLDCLECRRKNQPTFVFIDITNRCNLNCPICINNTPSMGFVFEPPIGYFDTIFRELSRYDPRPTVQLFGGEPTVRDDMFEIIEMARSYGLGVRVVTNGIKLADEDYCRRLVESRATILMAYDGADRETYRVLRGSAKMLAIKQRAIENLRKLGARKVCFMTCVAKGFNDGELPGLLDLCAELRGMVRGVYFMPLAQTWDLSEFDLEPERMTSEDIEVMLDGCFPGERIEFVPAGVLGNLPMLMKYLKVKRPPFMGAHPNCESMYLLIFDGERYVPVSRYLKDPVPDVVRALFAVEDRFAGKVRSLESSAFGRLLAKLGLKDRYLSARALLSTVRTVGRHLRLDRLLRGRGVGRLWHALCLLVGLLFRRKTRVLLEKHTNFHEQLQLIVLPFEDPSTLETARLERCPNAFVFYDVARNRVNTVPVCAWSLHKNEVLRAIADHYAQAGQPTG